MKKILGMLVLMCTVLVSSAALAAGTGTADDPITIGTVDEFKALASSLAEDGGEGKYYALTADLDFGSAKIEAYCIGTAAVPFKGDFNGNGHVIKNYTFACANNGVYGLFAYVGGNAKIYNLGIESAELYISAWDWAGITAGGGLVAIASDSAEISNCYAKNITITRKYSNPSPGYCQFKVGGGLVGRVDSADVVIKNCYAKDNDIHDSHTNADGGLIGLMEAAATVTDCYSTTTLAKCNTGCDANISNSYCFSNTNYAESGTLYAGTLTDETGIKSVTFEGLKADTTIDNVNGGCPMLDWEIKKYACYGDSAEYPIEIGTADELKALASMVAADGGAGKYYALTADIDLGATTWTSFIGTATMPFKGDFNGNGHTIKSYRFACDNGGVYGLFAYVGDGAKIYDLGLESVGASITLWDWSAPKAAGALAGIVSGDAQISGCFIYNATFARSNPKPNYCQYASVGGLIGVIDSADVKITNCYAYGVNINDSHANYDGGLIGEMSAAAAVTNCYSDTTLVRCTSGSDANISNTYCLNNTNYAPSGETYAGTLVSADELKAKAVELGDSFVRDITVSEVRGGYPMLAREISKYDLKGTKANPIPVASIYDYKVFQKEYPATEGMYFILTADLDFNAARTDSFCIGTEAEPFKGDFNGNGHVIKNFTLACANKGVYGIFAYVGGNAKIYNLGIDTVSAYVGAWDWAAPNATASLAGIVTDAAEISGCYVKNVVHSRSNPNPNYCQFQVAGGLIGRIISADVKVSNCYAYDIDMHDGYSTDDGGLVGFLEAPAVIDGCYSTVSLARCKTGDDANVTNSYYVDDGHWMADDTLCAGTVVEADELSSAATKDNLYFVIKKDINEGSPALAWECGFDVISNATVSNGQVVSVSVEKWNEKAGLLMIAGYDSLGNLKNVELYDTVSTSGDYVTDFTVDGAEDVKVFLWDFDDVEALSKVRQL